MNPSPLTHQRGFALVEAVLWLVFAAAACAALASAWVVASKSSGGLLWESAAKAAASQAMMAAKSTGYPACGAGSSRSACAFPSSTLDASLSSAGWSVQAWAQAVSPAPSQAGSAPAQLIHIHAVATDSRGTAWVLDEYQGAP